MKIGIVTEYFYPTLGGITENIYHLCRELLARGHDFRIITGKVKVGAGFSPRIAQAEACGYHIDKEIDKRIIYIGKSIPVFFNGSQGKVSFAFKMSSVIEEIFEVERFDVIHIHSPLFPTLSMISNLRANAPIVGTFHTCLNGGSAYYRIFEKRLRMLLDRMSTRIAVSRTCAEENKFYTGLDFDVIPNGVDVNWWEREERKPDGLINIAFMGRPDIRNGLDKLIEAFKIVNKKYSNTRLLVIGDGPLMFMFKKMVGDFPITFHGAANETRPDLLQNADIFVFAPLVASFGITILEGMSAKKAIIASDIPAFRELLVHNKDALLIDPNSSDQIAKAIERLVIAPKIRVDLAESAHQKVWRYDWKNVAGEYLECYKAVIVARHGNP